MITSYDLFPLQNSWPPPSVLNNCAHCGCLVGNTSEAIDKHVAWHNLIAEIGGAQ